ncbi:multidrug effflux MFS transporter [Staphylococcus pseudoxylosus]|uniref:Bcr/CflA family efflux transporter n=1 Tax=Staphylococcus pseudoxylosus TaxID=2282419 RepID=A0AAQ0S7V7_9STAP|nr:multidrug effflux MFS transporter [Staphylococcus pseudoxylosus]PTI84105.1 Bcr/CflA family drug resistance efflux transporter [Staphylococcus xylosus]MBM2657351.1 multidrug effflux MFS transporter [Staphylococcus pseudoxylosus]MCE5001190.1 multidrug effflux MFS transporter [Staphylococcus pseudoxylosus]MEB5782192.1 multidrug effflux MFS transporter [Staphylococcus pseudoxylosus]MEB6169990.1 multidrug effflux MFS transporter [Staphylococcus pseudoxylosus]
MDKITNRQLPLMVIIMLGIMTTFGPLTIDMYVPSLPNVQSDFGTTTSQVQLTLSFAMIGLAIGQFTFGPLSDAYGRKKIALLIISIYVIASLIAVFTTSLTLLLIIRLIQGLTGGGAIVIAKASIGDQHKGKSLAKGLASLLVVNGIITILAPLIGGYALSVSNWKAIFLILTIVSFAILIFAFFKMEETRDTDLTKLNFSLIFKDFGYLLKKPAFIIPMLLQGLTYVMLFSFSSAAPFITQKIYDMTPQQFSILFALNGIGLIIMSQLTALLVEYINRYFLLVLLTLIQIAGVVLIIFTLIFHLPLWVLIIAFFLNVCPVTGIGPLSFTLAMESRTGGSGNASSLLGLFQFILGGIMSPLVGLKGEYSVMPYLIILTITAILIILLEILLKSIMLKRNV